MPFKSTYLKLTTSYVLIIMAISLSFSIVIHRISSAEIDRGLGRQINIYRGMPINPALSISFEQLEAARLKQAEESKKRLTINLIYFNLLILILSSVASYFLAKWTLKPIKESMEGQNRFTADASHELRTPLTAIRSEIEVGLRDKKLTIADSRKLLTSNLEEISKLETLSKALLKLANGEEGLIKFKEVSLEEVIIEAYEKVAKLAEAKKIEFDNQLADIQISGDKSSLVELFVILLDNAIKYSPTKSNIECRILNVDDKVCVKIIDHGIGIKASDLPHIFDRFYRADLSRSKEKADGYGLGLSIAKRIVEMHKASILINSTPGKGSEFVVKF